MLKATDLPLSGRQALSSLMDGDFALQAWPEVAASAHLQAEQRATWHCYQLIGDVMRSDELATDPCRDSAMLQALRKRLAEEPVPLAPGALAPLDLPRPAEPTQRHMRLAWMKAPAAIAAGFVAVAGVLVVLRSQAPTGSDASSFALGNATAEPSGLRQVVQPEAGVLVRNAGLDRYLGAHRKIGNSVALAGATDQRVQIVFESK
jgi:sigma-E factor negative regulatory protein RseA